VQEGQAVNHGPDGCRQGVPVGAREGSLTSSSRSNVRRFSEQCSAVDGGQLKPVTDRVFPFGHIPDAFAYLEERHAKGKVIVRL
jgi:NADPH:quinone reductase-like Zn-dependent oxidoreductase